MLNSSGGEGRGTATNDEGSFSIGGIPPGRYFLRVSLVGYRAAADTLTIEFGQRLQLTLEMAKTETAMDELVVEQERRPARPRGAGIETIPPEALARVPPPRLSADLTGYITTMPGVVTRGDQGGQLFIRGGAPTQNLVLVDGVPVFHPFHLIGFYSAFPADIVSYVDVYAGGFGAEYGGRIASVIDIHTRTGNKQRFEGSASLAPFLSAISLNVPVVPGSVSLMGSVRESMIERLSPFLLGDSLPFHFGDQFARLHAFLNPITSLSVTFLHSYDDGLLGGTPQDPKRIQRDNLAVGAHFNYLPSLSAVRFQARAYYSDFTNRYTSTLSPDRFSATSAFGGKMDFTYHLETLDFQFGLFARTNNFGYSIGRGAQDLHTTEGGLFAAAEINLNDAFDVEPGLRLHTYTSSGQTSLSPRLRMAWRPGDVHGFTAAAGLYHQQIVGLYNLRDVTDVFIAWRPSEKFEEVPQAVHLLDGWTGRVAPWLSVKVDGYHKTLSNLSFIAYNDLTGDTFTINRADGSSRGVELVVRGSRGPVYYSVGYGLAEVLYRKENALDIIVPRDGLRPVAERVSGSFHPPHDRRHQIDILAGYDDDTYAVSVSWQFGSGLPFTPAYGTYNVLPVVELTDEWNTEPGQLHVDFAEPYSARLPAYHRLDVSASRTFHFGGVDLALQGSVINLYDRANIFDYNFLSGRRTNQLPLVPSLGFEVSF